MARAIRVDAVEPIKNFGLVWGGNADALAITLDQGILLDAALENLLMECALDYSPNFAYAHACSEALNNILVMVLDAGFYKSLQKLKNQLPASHQSQGQFQSWWQSNYPAWIDQLKQTIVHYRNIHHLWQFSEEQQQTLKRYYDANQLLVDCLNSNCEVTETICQDIADSNLKCNTLSQSRCQPSRS